MTALHGEAVTAICDAKLRSIDIQATTSSTLCRFEITNFVITMLS